MESSESVPKEIQSKKRAERIVMDWQTEVLEDLRGVDSVRLGSAVVHAVPSDSDPSDFYYILKFPEGKIVCAKCKGFRYNDTCKHVKEFE